MKKLLLALTISYSILMTGCCFLFPSKCKDNEGSYETIANNVTTPQYLPLNLPMSTISLPALLVGEQGLPSGGCFMNDAILTTSDAPDSLIQVAERQKTYSDSLHSKFEKGLVKAGLDAAISRALMQQFTTKVYGIKIVQVDPANTFANFKNTNCNTSELDWFINKRKVIIAGLKADSIVVTMGSSLTAAQQAKVDAAIDTLNLQLGLSFSRAVSSSGQFSFSGKNLFFGALTTSLEVKKCQQEYEFELNASENLSFDFCQKNYTVLVTKATMGNHFTVTFFDKMNATLSTGELDIPVNNAYSVIVGENRRVNFFIKSNNGNENKFNMTVTMYIVGISGHQ
jgi:hypothetical protein